VAFFRLGCDLLRAVARVKKPSVAARNQLHARHARDRNTLAVQYVARLRPLLASLKNITTRAIAALPWPRVDVAQDAAPSVASARKSAEALFDRQADKLAKQAVLAAQGVGGRWVDEDARKTFGINVGDLRKGSSTMSRNMKQAIEDNVSLIKTIPAKHFDRIEKIIRDAFDKGKRAEDIAADIQETGEITDRRAAFIARDQMAKVTSAANEDRLLTLGVERYIWSTSQDERVRKVHAELDGLEFRFDDPPDSGTDGEPLSPGFPINCFPGETLLASLVPIEKIYRYWSTDDLTAIVTATGETLRATARHPILTRRGWVAAESLDVGDDVVKVSFESGQFFVDDPKHVQAFAHELFSAGLFLGVPKRVGVRVGFHGDAVDQEVDIVLVDRDLPSISEALFTQEFCEAFFAEADQAALPFRPFDQFLVGAGSASHGIVRGACKVLALLFGCLGHSREHALAAVAWLHALADQIVGERFALDAETLRDLLDTVPGDEKRLRFLARIFFCIGRRAAGAHVSDHASFAQLQAERVSAATTLASDRGKALPAGQKFLRVVQKTVRKNAGCHVFNLQTMSGWYVAQSLAVRNCRCVAIPLFDEVS